tara:strand:+ start:403 stop:1398 length:996 start_codon:yes stop_codon:yes gene_type:complete
MSDMLKQAIIDANALKEAAVKNAETLVIEKYSSEIKDTIQKLLSEEEAMGATTTATIEPTTTSVVNDLPSSATNDDSDMVSLDLTALAKKIDADDAEEPEGSEMRDRDEIADDIEADLGIEFDELQEEIEIDEDDLKEVINSLLGEKVTVDIEPQKDGYLETPTSHIQDAVEEAEAAAAHLDEDEEETVDEEKEELKEAVSTLQDSFTVLKETNEKYEQAILSLKESLDEMGIQNARLLYSNRALTSNSLNGRQKDKIVEAISKAKTVEEAKVIYETLQETVGGEVKTKTSTPNSLTEAVTRRSSALVSHTDEKPQADPRMDRMKRLAGLN